MTTPKLFSFRPTDDDRRRALLIRDYLIERPGYYAIGLTTILREALRLAEERLTDIHRDTARY